MLSPGSPSKYPVQVSPSSIPSLLYCVSDHTEDESEVFFSEGEAAGALSGPKPHPLANGSTQILESPLTLNQRGIKGKNGPTGYSPSTGTYTGQNSVSSKRIPTQGDLAFARKCSELHGYIRPLLLLLNGLKTGRYVKGLSTFQQSVAMDRLQRIVGVLQKPDLGEKYMGTLLQLEMMLKVWFPQVEPHHRNAFPSPHNPMTSLSPRWNQDQLHIPVKKRRLSWSDSDSQSSYSCKREKEDERGYSSSETSSWLSSSETTCSEFEDNAISTDQKDMTSKSEPIHNIEKSNLNLSVQEMTSINMAPEAAAGRPPPLVIPPLSTDGSSMDMQDCSVSSTTPTHDPPAEWWIGGNDVMFPIAGKGHSESVKGEGPKKRVTRKMYPSKMLST